MYTPHTVTIFNVDINLDTLLADINAVVIDGVFLDISEGANIQKSGLESANKATLYIPFSAVAVDPVTGDRKKYLSPKEYGQREDKSAYWTIRKTTDESSVPCYFIKGKVDDLVEYETARNRFDYVYDVKTIDLRDFGSADMQHWEVGGV